MKNRLLTTLFAIAVIIFIITFSISLPIYCRFFYYLQIKPLGIEKITGYDYNTIKTAYDEVLNYLTLPGFEFGTGVFTYTEAGKAHFVDCKGLFNLNIIALLISASVIITLLILNKKKVITLVKTGGFSASFYGGIALLSLFLIIGIFVAIDFDTAFKVFHQIFFPGKDNWMFSSKDQIIYALPSQFFLNCGILIFSSIIIITTTLITVDIVKKVKNKK